MTLYRLFTSFVLIFLLTAVTPAESQVTCAQIGKFLSCDAPRGQNSTQLDLGNGMGVITGQSEYGAPSYLEPYAVMPTPTSPSPVPAPLAPQPPLFPTIESLGDPLEAPQAPMLFAPLSFGDAGP